MTASPPLLDGTAALALEWIGQFGQDWVPPNLILIHEDAKKGGLRLDGHMSLETEEARGRNVVNNIYILLFNKKQLTKWFPQVNK